VRDDDVLFAPDTPEGRAIEQIAYSLADRSAPGQIGLARKMARIAAVALVELVGNDDASSFFAGISADCLRQRGRSKGARKSVR
jgi:hypothetical protein